MRSADQPDTDAQAPRVVQVVTQREPAGAQRVAHRLREGFAQRGVGGTVVFLYRKAEAFEDEDYVDLRDRRPGVWGTAAATAALIGMLRRDKPVAVIGHEFHANLIAGFAGWVARVPRRVAVHHVLGQFEGLGRRLVLRLLQRTPLVDVHVYVSETTLASFGSWARRNGVVIHNGISELVEPTDGWAGDPRADPARPLLLSIGRLADEKDHKTSISAMQHIDHADLVILGEGELRTQLETQVADHGVSDRVHLVGNIAPEDVRHALGRADLVVQPSIWEAFPMVPLEAMAAGKPLVLSDIPAHREALAEEAVYFAVGDAAALADAVRVLLSRPDQRERLGAGSQKRAARFTHDSTVQRYLDLIGANAAE